MSKWVKRVLSVILVMVMSGIIMPIGDLMQQGWGIRASAADSNASHLLFGSYPQTKVTSASVITELNKLTPDSNQDVSYGGSKYRKGSGASGWFKHERISWRILSRDSSAIYVMAESILDARPYNTAYVNTTWETCDLRPWLNNKFYGLAFTSAEQGLIKSTSVVNNNNAVYGTPGGNTTADKIYLLSAAEATNGTYGFSSTVAGIDVARRAQGSDYAKSIDGLFVNETATYYGNSYWWLRSPGAYADKACGIRTNGSVVDDGSLVDAVQGVRPVMRLDPAGNYEYTNGDTDAPNGTKISLSSSHYTATINDIYGVVIEARITTNLETIPQNFVTWSCSDPTAVVVTSSYISDNRKHQTFGGQVVDMGVWAYPFVNVKKTGTYTITATTTDGASTSRPITVEPAKLVTSTKTYSTSDPSIAAQKYAYAMQEYITTVSSQAQAVQADKQKEAMEATVAKWNIAGGYGHNAQVQKVAKEALILYLVNSDYYKKNVNLKNASSSKIESMAVKIVKNVYKNFSSESEQIEQGGYLFKIWIASQWAGYVASISLITPANPYGSPIYTSVGNIEDVIADFMKQSVNLGWDALEIAVEEVVKELTGKTVKDTLKAATNNLLKLPKSEGGFGFGDVNDALDKAYQIFKITSQIADVKKVPPDDPAKMYNWAKGVNDTANEYAFGNETLTDVVVSKAFEALKDARTELINATTSYMMGTTYKPPGDPNKSWAQNVGDYIWNLIKCPVDITVYGSGNQVLGYVRGNEVVNNSDDIYIYKDGEFKGVYYKKNANLRIELTGTAFGILDISVDEYTNNQPMKRTNYFDFTLEEGKAITASASPSGGNSVYSVSEGGALRSADEMHSFNNVPKYTIETFIQGEGFVTQGGTFNSGDAVSIASCPLEGYVFKGWYIDGCLVSLNPVYSFTAKQNISLVGRFDPYIEHTYDDDQTISGVVWLDARHAAKGTGIPLNGVINNEESFIEGVVVHLFRSNGTPYASVITNVDGSYQFTNVPDGSYYLEFEYDGINYEGGLQSYAQINEVSRNAFNQKFATIQKMQTAMGLPLEYEECIDGSQNASRLRTLNADKTVMPNFAMRARSSIYTVSNSVDITDVNFGVFQRELDLGLELQIKSVQTTINGQALSYGYNTAKKVGDAYCFTVPTDSSNSARVTYQAIMYNNTIYDGAVINEVAAYFPDAYNYVSASLTLASGTKAVSALPEGKVLIDGMIYNKILFSGLDCYLGDSGSGLIQIDFDIKGIHDLQEYSVFAEMMEYSTVDGRIDRNSSPGNAITKSHTWRQENDSSDRVVAFETLPNGFTYEIVDGEAIITGHVAPFGALEIPSIIAGYPVTRLKENAFSAYASGSYKESQITSVLIPGSVKTIGYNAFKACFNLESVIICEGVEVIEAAAFYDCIKLKTIQLPRTIALMQTTDSVSESGVLVRSYHQIFSNMDYMRANLPTQSIESIYVTENSYADLLLRSIQTTVDTSVYDVVEYKSLLKYRDSQRTLTLNANGGAVPANAINRDKNTIYALPTPTKSYKVYFWSDSNAVIEDRTVNAVFGNWWKNANFTGTGYAANSAYTINATETLYAKWTNPAVGTLPTPSRAGYNFDGWYFALSGGTKYSSTTVITGDTVLYGHWSPITYAVTYNLNGGAGTTPTETSKAVGATFAAASTTGLTAPAGKQFKQWNTSNAGTGTAYAAGATITMPANALTLYAIWENIPITTYTVTYNLNGGSGPVPTETSKAAGATFAAASATGLTAPAGKQFKQWNTSSAGTGTAYAAGATITMPANALTLYAIWENISITTYTVTYNLNGGSGPVPTETSKAAGATFAAASAIGLTAPVGKRFKQWNTNNVGTGTAYEAGVTVTMPASGLILYAIWENISPTTYTIIVQTDGNGSASASSTSATQGAEITLAASANSGYRFKQWQVISGGVTITNNKFTMPASAVTVKAIFETAGGGDTKYALTVVGGSGSGDYVAGATVPISANIPSGKVFDKWSATSGTIANSTSASTTFTMPTGAATVTATFKDVPKGIFGTNAKWYGAWWHYLLFFFCFGFIWMW